MQRPGVAQQKMGQDEQELMNQARQEANREIIKAKQQKAVVDPAQGWSQERYSDMVDDEFFHITCHVDQALKTKIVAG